MLLDQNPETIIQETKWFPDLHLTTLEQAFIMEGQDICNQIIYAAMIIGTFPILHSDPAVCHTAF